VNYYQHHIGDFNSGTVRMPQLARWLYRDMIEVYYDTEKPLPADFEVLCMSIGAVGEEQRAAVKIVLTLKFKLQDDGYHHDRCDSEIEKYRAKADSASVRGKLGGRPRKADAKLQESYSFPVANQQDSNSQANETYSQANQEPITNNQEPEEKQKSTARSSIARATRFDARKWLIEQGVDPKVADDWLKVRKAKRLASTETAFADTAEQAALAGLSMDETIRLCVVRGWGGFKASWDRDDGATSIALQAQRKAGSRAGANTTQKSRFDLKSTTYDGPVDAPFDF
jgi:uncharacterized protein YdaU (DUF1376 family)